MHAYDIPITTARNAIRSGREPVFEKTAAQWLKEADIKHRSISLLPSYRYVERLLRRVKNRWKGRPLSETGLTHSISSVKVTSANIDGGLKVKEIIWADVIEAVAYKRDSFTVDLICIALVGHGNVLEINEEMEGWNELLDHLPRYLPECRGKDKWYPEVMLPPFRENRTLIFSRR